MRSIEAIEGQVALLEQRLAQLDADKERRAAEIRRLEEEQAAADGQADGLRQAIDALRQAAAKLRDIGPWPDPAPAERKVGRPRAEHGAIRRAIVDLLEAEDVRAQGGLRAADIIARIPWAERSVRSFLSTAKRAGVISQDAATKRYQLRTQTV